MESQDVYSSDIESVMQGSAKSVYDRIRNRVDSMYEYDQNTASKPKNQFAMRKRDDERVKKEINQFAKTKTSP